MIFLAEKQQSFTWTKFRKRLYSASEYGIINQIRNSGKGRGKKENMGKFCPSCGRELHPEDRFCSGCGRAISGSEKVCSNCGSPLKPGQEFCPVCGRRTDGKVFCKKCGKDLDATQKFCPSCGTPAMTAAPQAVPYPAQNVVFVHSPAEQEKRRARTQRGLNIAEVCTTLAVLFILFFCLLGQRTYF